MSRVTQEVRNTSELADLAAREAAAATVREGLKRYDVCTDEKGEFDYSCGDPEEALADLDDFLVNELFCADAERTAFYASRRPSETMLRLALAAIEVSDGDHSIPLQYIEQRMVAS